jgi:hypothetical protein
MNFTSSRVIGSLEMNVVIANDVDWLSERHQATKDVSEVDEERSGRCDRSRTVHDGDDAR